jgi:hypothetical protein
MDDHSQDEAATKLALKLRNLLRRRALEKLYRPRPAPTVFPLRERFTNLYPFVASTVGEDAPVTYLEFGVFRGASIKRMSHLFRHPEARFIGFDSFEGLATLSRRSSRDRRCWCISMPTFIPRRCF